jgi:hypothetical protein
MLSGVAVSTSLAGNYKSERGYKETSPVHTGGKSDSSTSLAGNQTTTAPQRGPQFEAQSQAELPRIRLFLA